VCRSQDPADAAVLTPSDRDHEVIPARWQNAVYAFNLSCPRQNTALRWNEGDAQCQCPKHHSEYRPNGAFTSGRATRAVDRRNITRSGDTVVDASARAAMPYRPRAREISSHQCRNKAQSSSVSWE
jgi:nitrite reductase/ring-hydroxylating ferredoxin subunit